MRRITPVLIIVATGMLAWLASIPLLTVAASASVEYLGEGGSYTIESGRHFIVKHVGPFSFVNEPGPTYNAAPGERVWASTKNAPVAHVKTTVDYGFVNEGCKISYTAIDDDPDDRINIFYIGGEAVHDMPQGFVTGGQFSAPRSGELTLHAEDSIGIWLNRCQEEASPTPSPTTEPEVTPSTTPEPTETPGPSPTPTSTKKPMPTPASSATPDVPEPTQTAIPPTPTATPEPRTVTATPTPTKKPRLPACLRINFEMSGDSAQEGIYEVREVGGRLLYSWSAEEGWHDSGWVFGIDISFEDVYIEVFFVPADGPRIRMDIVNPSPGTDYGWLSRGMCHALEVGWPDENITPTPTPDAHDGFNDEFDLQALDVQRFFWPDIQPTATSTPASSLRG